MKIVFHKRIKERHPEVKNEEINEAINNTINWIQRLNNRGEIFGIGITSKGKFIEYAYIEHENEILVYHAQFATDKGFKELGLMDRRKNEDR